MEKGKEKCSYEHTTNGCSYEHTTSGEILRWVELSCWTMVASAPFLYWLNGPAVSTDQFVVRTILVSVAVVVGIRVASWATRS